MNSDTAVRAKKIYQKTLRDHLEANYANHFVAIEPDSGEYFLGHTLSAAIVASRTKHPEKLVHTIRIGHPTAVHFGMHTQ